VLSEEEGIKVIVGKLKGEDKTTGQTFSFYSRHKKNPFAKNILMTIVNEVSSPIPVFGLR